MCPELLALIKPQKDIFDIFAALAPVLISFGVAYIAFQQWRTAEKKRRQDLFDKRYDFFRRIWKIYERQIVEPALYPPLDDSDVLDLVHEAEFLFGSDIVDHLFELPKNIKKGCLEYDWFSKPFHKYLALEK